MFLIVQLPPFSHHLIPLRSKYSSQNPVLKHPQWSVTLDKIFTSARNCYLKY
jgi:hypothetical protein